METIHAIAALRARLAGAPRPVFLPTMGSLHEGHLALASAARAEAAARGMPTVASIFVNRLQFAPHEDFDRYPRTLAADAALLEREGIDILFAPDETELYPIEQTFRVQPDAALAGQLEGHFRPGFFEGVCTVVLKLFGAVQPAVAVFGRKDWQQLVVVQRMVEQFALPIDILSGATVRAPDGLALSSRNAYLSPAERAEAPRLQATLREARARLLAGEPAGRVERDAHDALQAAGWQVDYVAVRGQTDLAMPQDGPLVVLAAARLGATRLIDNIEVA